MSEHAPDCKWTPNHHSRDELIARNGRWGTCVDCPRRDGTVYPGECVNTDRYDHNLEPEGQCTCKPKPDRVMPGLRAINFPLALQLESLWMHDDVRGLVDRTISKELLDLIPTLNFDDIEFIITCSEYLELTTICSEYIDTPGLICKVHVSCRWRGFTGISSTDGYVYFASEEAFKAEPCYARMCETAHAKLVDAVQTAGWSFRVTNKQGGCMIVSPEGADDV